MSEPTATAPAGSPPKGGTRSAVLLLGALLVGLVLGILAPNLGDGWKEPLVQAAGLVGGLWLDALRMTVAPPDR